jgi:Holliday junction resolvasome RuvABC endonuclease subunit
VSVIVAIPASPIYWLGIDASATSTGVTLLSENNTSETLLIQPKELRDGPRLLYIYKEMAKFISNKKIDLACMEAPSYNSTNMRFTLGGVYGVMQMFLAAHKIPLLTPAIKQIKKYGTKRGSATKEDMIAAAAKHGCPSSQEDICDSWIIALLCKEIASGTNQIRTREALEIASELRKELGEVKCP